MAELLAVRLATLGARFSFPSKIDVLSDLSPSGGSRAFATKDDIMATGTVKWFNDTKGYGFIQPESGGKDVFVHVSAVERSGMNGLVEGQKISYEVEADRRSGKESAVNLKAAG